MTVLRISTILVFLKGQQKVKFFFVHTVKKKIFYTEAGLTYFDCQCSKRLKAAVYPNCLRIYTVSVSFNKPVEIKL